MAEWKANLDDLTVTEARRNLRELEDAVQEAAEAFDAASRLDGANFWTTFFGRNLGTGASSDFNDAVKDAVDRVGDGTLALEDFREEIDRISEQFRDGSEANRRYAEDLDVATKALDSLVEDTAEAQQIIAALTGDTEQAQEAFDVLGGSAEDTGAALATATQAGLEAFNSAMEDLRDHIPEATSELSKLEVETGKIETSLQAALTAAQSLPDALMRVAAEQEALALSLIHI